MKRVYLLAGAIALLGLFYSSYKKPKVMWYINLDNVTASDFFEKMEKYPPDIALLTVYSCDDYYALNDPRIDVGEFIEKLHKKGVKVFWGFSLFSHPLYIKDHPEVRAKRKPVEGHYVPPGQNTSVCPLYKNLQEYMISIINETINTYKPDGLSFDHTRFFTFDEGYNPLCKEFIKKNFGLDMDSHMPKPMFILNQEGGWKWKKEDRAYYDGRANIIHESTRAIISKFEDFEKWGTTMGMTEPARSNGQYAELQGELFDKLLLMAYDQDPSEVRRNLEESKKASQKPVILGLHPEQGDESILKNIDIATEERAWGVFLLGTNFSDVVYERLAKI